MKKWLKLSWAAVLALSLLVVLTACGSSSASSKASANQLSDKTITVGVTAGPHELIMKQVAKLAKKDGLTIKLKQFTDYNSPNVALNDGDLGANSYQTLPFLKEQIKSKNFKSLIFLE